MRVEVDSEGSEERRNCNMKHLEMGRNSYQSTAHECLDNLLIA
jgi:hypothetical protein